MLESAWPEASGIICGNWPNHQASGCVAHFPDLLGKVRRHWDKNIVILAKQQIIGQISGVKREIREYRENKLS